MSKKGQVYRPSAGKNKCELWRANGCACSEVFGRKLSVSSCMCLGLHFHIECLKIFSRISAECVQGVVKMGMVLVFWPLGLSEHVWCSILS